MLSSQRGMTLIEVSITILVICGGTLATLGTYAHFSKATQRARERAVLISVAQREMEALRPLDYDKLALAGSPTTQAGTEAPLTGPAASETLATGNGGIVRQGPDTFSYRGAKGRIYRYITLRPQICSGLTVKVQNQLATLFSQAVSTVAASLPDVCSANTKTKRITVVVVPTDGSAVTGKGVRLSTIKQDPKSNGLDIAGSTLSVKSVSATTATSVTSGSENVATQTLTLLDTRCSSATRATPASHATSDTSQAGFTCTTSGPAPTLLSLGSITTPKTDPVQDFSSDVTRSAVGGLALLRDTQAGSCTAADSLVYTNSETNARKHAIHTWASKAAGQPVETPTSSARASLSLWTSTANGVSGPGRLCVTLRRASTGAVIGSSDFSLTSWPGQPTQLVTAFDLSHVTLAVGERLLLTLRVPADSGNDLRILYDHASYPSALSFTTLVGKELL
jgi:prepilin-type N-terminal cleavage/methylation domain-containing protein